MTVRACVVPCVRGANHTIMCLNFYALTMHACNAEPGRTTAYSPDIGWRVFWQLIGMEYTLYEQIGRRLQIAPIESFLGSKTPEMIPHESSQVENVYKTSTMTTNS